MVRELHSFSESSVVNGLCGAISSKLEHIDQNLYRRQSMNKSVFALVLLFNMVSSAQTISDSATTQPIEFEASVKYRFPPAFYVELKASEEHEGAISYKVSWYTVSDGQSLHELTPQLIQIPRVYLDNTGHIYIEGMLADGSMWKQCFKRNPFSKCISQ
jgi:hypothetical protein